MAYTLNQHEYQVFENGTWSASRQTNMVQLPDGRQRITDLTGNYDINQVRVRVMAIDSNPPSDWLYNNEAFTAQEPVQYTDRVNVVMAGNSIVFGYNADTNYPVEMDNLLPSNYTITNIGQSGWNITQINGQREQIDGLWDDREGATNVLMCQEGINSFAQGQSLDDYYTSYNSFMSYFRNKGWKVIGVTPTAYNYNGGGEIDKQKNLITRMQNDKNIYYDALLDWSTNKHIGSFTNPNSADFAEYFPDGLHPSSKGQKLMGRMAYDVINNLFNNVPINTAAQALYPNEVFNGEPIVFTEAYNTIVDGNLVYGAPGISQRDNWVYGSQQFTAGEGLRGFVEFSINSATHGFVGLSYKSGQEVAGGQIIALSIENNGSFSAWQNWITNLGTVGGKSAAWDRLRMEVYSDKVVWYKVGETTPFYTWNNAPTFPCRFSVICDGTGHRASFYNCYQG